MSIDLIDETGIDLIWYLDCDPWLHAPKDEETLKNVVRELQARGVRAGHELIHRYLKKSYLIVHFMDLEYFDLLRMFQTELGIELSKVLDPVYIERSILKAVNRTSGGDQKAVMRFIEFYLNSNTGSPISNPTIRGAYHNWKKEKFFRFCLLQNADRKPEGVPDIPDDVLWLIARNLLF